MRDAEFRERIADEVARLLGDPAKTKQALIRYESIWYSKDARTATPEEIAREIVGEATGAARARRFTRRRNARAPGAARGADEKSCGFAIAIYDQRMIEENAREHYMGEAGGPASRKYVTTTGEITDAGWAQINRDVQVLERNALRWLKNTFVSAQDEGHDKYNDLIGSVWYDPENAEQMRLIELASPSPGHGERIDMTDASYGNLADYVWHAGSGGAKGVSAFGESVLGGAITFFDVDEDF